MTEWRSLIVLNYRGKRLVKKAYAEIERKCISSAFTCTFLMMTIKLDSPRTNYAGSLQEAKADTWRKKFSNVNVAMRNVKHFNLKKQQTGRFMHCCSEVKSATY